MLPAKLALPAELADMAMAVAASLLTAQCGFAEREKPWQAATKRQMGASRSNSTAAPGPNIIQAEPP